MTGRDTPASDPVVRLLDEAGVPGNPALTRALDGIGVLAAGPAPEASAELARLMAAGGRAPAGRRNKRRITFLGGALAVSMGVGMSGVAAGPFPFQGGSDDTVGAGTRFAARESADRIRDLPAPPAPSAENSGDSESGRADRSPAVSDVATPPGAAGAAPVIEARPGLHVALPAGSAAPVEAGLGTAGTPRSDDQSTLSVASPAAHGAHPVLGDPVQPSGPSPAQRNAVTSDGSSAAGPGTAGTGARPGSHSSGPAAGAAMDVGDSADRAAERGAGSVGRKPLGGSATPDTGPGARGPIDRPVDHRTFNPSNDGGLAAVGPDRVLGGAAQGAPASVSGTSPQRDPSVTRLHASFRMSPNGASVEGGLFGPVVAEEEGNVMFALFLGSANIDAGEWGSDELSPVLPEDAPEAVDASTVSLEGVDASTVDAPAPVVPSVGASTADPAVDGSAPVPAEIPVPDTAVPTPGTVPSTPAEPVQADVPAGPLRYDAALPVPAVPDALGPDLLDSTTPAGALEDTPDRSHPSSSDAVPDPAVSGQAEGE